MIFIFVAAVALIAAPTIPGFLLWKGGVSVQRLQARPRQVLPILFITASYVLALATIVCPDVFVGYYSSQRVMTYAANILAVWTSVLIATPESRSQRKLSAAFAGLVTIVWAYIWIVGATM